MQATYDFISYEKYQDLCHRKEIKTPADQKALVGFLHDLGIVLNFQDDPRLQETNVLNPEWVTTGVYDLLNNHDLMLKHKGILSLSNLRTILTQPDRYPETKQDFLMRLMEKFELCFLLDSHEKTPRYLISDLLPIDEPDVDIYEDAPLHFQYHYDILPGSIISRFIVRNHALIYRAMRWRSGVVLTQDTSKALIRSDEEEGYISIKVVGSRANALLATIRADFTKIHATIPHLPVQEFLVIREIDNDRPTGREVPVEYFFLTQLERQGDREVSLPNLKGKYDPHTLLAGLVKPEYNAEYQNNEDDRLRQERSRMSRGFQPLKPLKLEPKRSPSLFRMSLPFLLILGTVTAIFTILAFYIPLVKLPLILLAIVLIFALISIIILLVNGTLTPDHFNQFIEGFWKSLPLLRPDTKPEQSERE